MAAAARAMLTLTLLTGVLYPVVVTVVARTLFPERAAGSPVYRDGRVIGSRLVGQAFSAERFFHGRPSATSPVPYDGAASGGSNLGPTHPALREAVAARVAALRRVHGDAPPVPVDLATASGSGLDPHVSPAAAHFQVPGVARARGLPEGRVRALVDAHVEGRTFGVLGSPRVNVLRLNLALEALR